MEKDSIFKAKKCENLLQPSYTNYGTLLSCRESRKINDPVFKSKIPFLDLPGGPIN